MYEIGFAQVCYLKIFQFCTDPSVSLKVQWIPRTENEKADYISCLIDFDDWQITHYFFLSLEELGGRIQLTVLLIIIRQSFL